jgi:hypothetical protein
MTRAHRMLIPLLAAVLTAAACLPEGEPVGRSLMEMARYLGSDVVRTLARGYVPGRSGEIVLVPEPWNVLGQWSGGVRGQDDPRTSHSTPWAYHQQVPLSLYGPGYVRPNRLSRRPVDVADLAPTLAELMGVEFEAPDGRVLRESLVPRAARPRPPRAIVVVVIDGGGWNVLHRWPDAWPAQRRLMGAGTTFTNATVGSAPTVTAPIHATIGTGAYPRVHGIAENTGRLPDGSIGDVTRGRGDLSMMRSATLAAALRRATDGRAWVGMLGHAWWHLTLLGPGDPADRDVGVVWDVGNATFTTNTSLYRLPSYLPPRSVLDRHLRELDATDGALDERWNDDTLSEDSYTFTGNPAFAAYQGDAARAIASREPIGQDEVTDLLFVELKTADVAGHIWNMLNPQVGAVLKVQDQTLEELVKILDRRVGRGEYVLAMTADHGQSPVPDAVGGLRIDRSLLLEDVNAEFGSVVEALHPGDLYAREAEPDLLEEMARFIGDYRFVDGMPPGPSIGEAPGDRLDERVFAAALPGWFLLNLTEAEINGLGPGHHEEGDLWVPVEL